MQASEVESLIQAEMPEADVRVASDDNTHFEALVIAEAFTGKRPLQRHQMVYKGLGTLMGNEIHALSIQALTPEEWSQRG
ncbi:MAG: BolA/IbaG family iron-sulfur metabolism protein [Pseudomonadota bacterium]